MPSHLKKLLYFALISFAITAKGQSDTTVYHDAACPASQFAVQEIKLKSFNKGIVTILKPIEALKVNKPDSPGIVLFTLNNSIVLKQMRGAGAYPEENLVDEGFCVQRTVKENPVIWVTGKDKAGMMYGGFEVAEIIEAQGIDAIADDAQNPYMPVRGTKFNIPLDVRTPSYSDVSDAAQNNMAEMWNMEFWKEYIDNLARHRYNLISLWNLHPFPSMVKLPEYPDIALNDVHQSTKHWNEHYHLCALDFDMPEIVNNYKVIKKMTIEEKIDFWREVMKYGKERNVRFFVVTWKIFVNGTFGKYGITDKIDNPVSQDRFRHKPHQVFMT